MEDLTIDEIIDLLNKGEIQISDIKDQIEELSSSEIEDMALELNDDENKILLLPYVMRPLKIIKSMTNEESIYKALEQLSNDKQKLRVITTYLKSDIYRKAGIDQIQSDEYKFLAKITLSREGMEEFFLPETRKYKKIGLDENLTLGIEIETEGLDSQEIIQVGKNNGLIHNKKMIEDQEFEIECGTIMKREDGKNWIVSGDSSLIDQGVEAISPILTDNENDVKEIYMVCNMLKKQDITERCGAHVHIGSDHLTSKEAYANLLEIFGNTERIMYLISNEAEEIPRRDVRKTCRTNFSINK